MGVVKGLLFGALLWLLWSKVGVAALVAVPLVMFFLLWWQQDSLLYMPRQGGYRVRPEHVPPLQNYEELSLICLDGTKITAWFIKQHARRLGSCPTILFLHGNAGTMGDRLDNARGLFASAGANILMVEYRGYGTSDGEPSEDGLMLDAQAGLDYIQGELHARAGQGSVWSQPHAGLIAVLCAWAGRKDVDRSRVVVFGRSLGGAVALWLAHRNPRQVRGVIAENTFTSVRDMALPLFPMLRLLPPRLLALLQASHWDSLARVAELPVPVLFIAGEQDEVVPHSQMLQLHAAHAAGAGSSVARCSRLAVFPGGSHNTTWMLPNYYGEIETFLKGLA